MRRIYNFSDFSKVYESEVPETDQSKLYDTTLNQIITSILNNYASIILYPEESYSDNVSADIEFVSLAPAERKVERFKEIVSNVREAAKDNPDPEAQKVVQAWVKAAEKSIEALEALIEQYQEDKEEVDYIGAVVDSRLEEYNKEREEKEKELQDQAKNSQVQAESFGFRGPAEDLVNEGIFEGKDGMMDEIEKQISIVNSKLGNLVKTPGMATSITKLQNEVQRISQRMGDLRQMRRRDISKEELGKIATRLAQIPSEAEVMSQKIAKQDVTNKDAAAILIQAFQLASEADKLEKAYVEKKEEEFKKKEEEEKKRKEEERDAMINIETEETIEFDPSKIGQINPVVQEVQKLLKDKFGAVEEIAELPQYIEFAKFGADGKFGERTKEMVKIIQAGLGMEDLSGNMSPSFIERIQTEPIKESRRIFKFSDFNPLFEDFSVSKAVQYAKKAPSYTKTYAKSSSGGTGKNTGSGTVFVKEGDLAEGWKSNIITVVHRAFNVDEEKDGKDYFGPKSKQAILDFQKEKDIPQTGVVDTKTVEKMIDHPGTPLGPWGIGVLRNLLDEEKRDYSSPSSSDKEMGNVASKIIAAVKGWGTKNKALAEAVQGIKSLADYKKVDNILKLSYSYGKASSDPMNPENRGSKARENEKILNLSGPNDPNNRGYSEYDGFVETINQEMESDNLTTVSAIAKHLKEVGVDVAYDSEYGYFKQNSFKVKN